MEFIDKTGHIFSLPSSGVQLGWEYSEQEYIMWMHGIAGPEVPVSSYTVEQVVPYIGSGNTLGQNGETIALDNIQSVKITCSSNIYKIKGYDKSSDGKTPVFDMTDEYMLSQNTYIVYNKNELIKSSTDILCPFFIIAKSDTEGTIMTNVLIEVVYKGKNDENVSVYTVVRIGAVFTDTSEKLEINAGNFGVQLPKEILSAVYQSPVVNGSDNFDASLYNEKLKEYLMNRMEISGETGSYNSMRKGMYWFGWSDKLKIFKLLKTDNKILNQYIRDDFDIEDDVINSFKRFRNAAVVSFRLKENDMLYYNNNNDKIAVRQPQVWNTDTDFNGESIPETEDLFKKYVIYNVGEYENDSVIEYYAPYYDYSVSCIMLKLALFKYYYKKYFCPVHTGVLTASVEHRCFIPDIKITQRHSLSISEGSCLCQDGCVVDIFGYSSYDINDLKIETLYINSEMHWIDNDFTEFSIYKESEYYDNVTDTSNGKYTDDNNKSQIYETHEMCIVVPVRFWSSISEKLSYPSTGNVNSSYIYKAEIIISKKVTLTGKYEEVYNVKKQFVQSSNNLFENIVLIPKLSANFKEQGLSWWTEGEYRIDICCGGRWFSQVFTVGLPALEVRTGYLEYKYDQAFAPVVYDIEGGTLSVNDKAGKVMWEPSLVGVTNSDYISDVMVWEKYGKKTDNLSIYNKDNIISKYADSFNIPSVELAPDYYNVSFYIDFWKDDGKPSEELNEYIENDYESAVAELFECTNYIFLPYWLCVLLDIPYNDENVQKISENIMKNLDSLAFDPYIMVDEEYRSKYNEKRYYIAIISRFNISSFIEVIKKLTGKTVTPNDVLGSLRNTLNITNVKEGSINIFEEIAVANEFKLPSTYAASTVSFRFLPNRMRIVSTKDSNTVPHNKILCCSLYRNENTYYDKAENGVTEDSAKILGLEDSFYESSFNLPFKMDVLSAKWKFIPYSVGIKGIKTVTSKANTALMSMQDSSTKYMSGYYNVNIEWSLDGKTTLTKTLPYKIRII